MAADFQVHLGDQWTGRIEHPQPAALRLLVHLPRYTVCAEDDRCIIRHLIQLIHEYRTECTQPFHHVTIVHHLVTHIDGGTEQFQRTLDDLDGAIDTGTETAGIGKEDFHINQCAYQVMIIID